MDSRLKGLIAVLEQTRRKDLCESTACTGINCDACPFEDDMAKTDLVNLLKTYELLED
ncbi:hypothetical protein HYP06_gp084 [Vibrio phage vB_VspP_pVa5]|uniref:Uncharacterized protein n=1 Tax=Vibrio phage vB_VspP_pVa5 TaxID=1913109 RepID=A0A1J0GVA9_9CAUD|nr:hypothetical protein HYP06_gp084 [Vibrio phage vB_VspP_pVa5]APC46122.1 hypothetical protein vBVspPpVa5_0089 [Vibrio phage vB_VspP_pVa5]